MELIQQKYLKNPYSGKQALTYPSNNMHLPVPVLAQAEQTNYPALYACMCVFTSE